MYEDDEPGDHGNPFGSETTYLADAAHFVRVADALLDKVPPTASGDHLGYMKVARANVVLMAYLLEQSQYADESEFEILQACVAEMLPALTDAIYDLLESF